MRTPLEDAATEPTVSGRSDAPVEASAAEAYRPSALLILGWRNIRDQRSPCKSADGRVAQYARLPPHHGSGTLRLGDGTEAATCDRQGGQPFPQPGVELHTRHRSRRSHAAMRSRRVPAVSRVCGNWKRPATAARSPRDSRDGTPRDSRPDTRPSTRIGRRSRHPPFQAPAGPRGPIRSATGDPLCPPDGPR